MATCTTCPSQVLPCKSAETSSGTWSYQAATPGIPSNVFLHASESSDENGVCAGDGAGDGATNCSRFAAEGSAEGSALCRETLRFGAFSEHGDFPSHHLSAQSPGVNEHTRSRASRSPLVQHSSAPPERLPPSTLREFRASPRQRDSPPVGGLFPSTRASPPRSVAEALELAALQGKLRLLNTQRELSAVRCQEFMDQIQRSWLSLEESTSKCSARLNKPKRRSLPAADSKRISSEPLSAELRQPKPGASELRNAEPDGTGVAQPVASTSRRMELGQGGASRAGQRAEKPRGIIPRSRSAACCSDIHCSSSCQSFEGFLKPCGNSAKSTNSAESLKADLSFYEDPRPAAAYYNYARRAPRRSPAITASKSAEFPVRPVPECEPEAACRLDLSSESPELTSTPRCHAGFAPLSESPPNATSEGAGGRSCGGVQCDPARGSAPGYRERRTSLRRYVSVSSRLDVYDTGL